MTASDECEEWAGWIIPVDPEIDARVEALARRHEPTTGAKRPLTRGEVEARVGRLCVACGHVVPERDEPPYAAHADVCRLASEWRALDMTRGE